MTGLNRPSSTSPFSKIKSSIDTVRDLSSTDMVLPMGVNSFSH